MAQTHQLLNFEPWLKPPKNRPLSHGSNPHLTCRFSHVKNRSFWFFFTYLFLYFKLAEWPTEEMAKILSESCTESENCSEEIFSKILNNCVHSEIESELFLDSVGYTTEFRE